MSDIGRSATGNPGQITSDAMVFFDVDGTLVDQQYMRSRALPRVGDEYLPGFDERQVTVQHDRILEDIVSLQASEPIDIQHAGALRLERPCAALGRPPSRAHAEWLYRAYRLEHQRALRGVCGRPGRARRPARVRGSFGCHQQRL